MIGDSVYPDTMGGSHRHIHDISRYISEVERENVTVYSPAPKYDSLKEEKIDGFTIRRYPKNKERFRTFIDFIWQPYKLFRSDLRAGYIPDIIHGHWPLTVFFIFLYVKMCRLPIKLVYTFHGPIVEEYKYELKTNRIIKLFFLFVVRIIEYIVLKLSKNISTASKYMRDKEIKLYGNKNKVFTNYLAIDLEKFKPVDNIPQHIKDTINWNSKNKYVFTIRRLKKRMGIQQLLQAFSVLIKTSKDYRLLIAGKGDYKQELEKLALNLGITDYVQFLGFVPDEDISSYYSISDVCVVPSLDLEGFGLTTVESMACGTPVVATNVCANTEILQAITPQFLCSLAPSDMAKKVYEASSYKKSHQFTLCQYIERTYTMTKTIRGYFDLYLN